MGQAFDDKGQVLGGHFGDTKSEVFEALNQRFPSAAEIRIRSLSPSQGAPDSPSVEMPRYKCHKEVWALKIRDITDPTQPGNETDGSRLLHFEEAGYGARRVAHDYLRKHAPKVGGYFVVYKDGYESFSPSEAFEDGYVLSLGHDGSCDTERSAKDLPTIEEMSGCIDFGLSPSSPSLEEAKIVAMESWDNQEHLGAAIDQLILAVSHQSQARIEQALADQHEKIWHGVEIHWVRKEDVEDQSTEAERTVADLQARITALEQALRKVEDLLLQSLALHEPGKATP